MVNTFYKVYVGRLPTNLAFSAIQIMLNICFISGAPIMQTHVTLYMLLKKYIIWNIINSFNMKRKIINRNNNIYKKNSDFIQCIYTVKECSDIERELPH